MFCTFVCSKLDNVSELSKYYGLNKHENEVRLVVRCTRLMIN